MRTTVRTILLLAVALIGGCLAAPLPPGPEAEIARVYLSEVVNQMEAGSNNRNTIDWTAFRAQVTKEGASARNIADTYFAIQTALTLLDDKHSYFRTPGGNFFTGRDPISCSAAFAPAPEELPEDIGYLRVASYAGSTAASAGYIASIQAAMALADGDSVTGWIIDLRGNGGGNFWPMLISLWPFLQGNAGHSVNPDEVWSTREIIRDEARLNGVTQLTVVDGYSPRGAEGRIAVLTDGRVASAAEGLAVAFRGRDNVRSFGTATCGLSTEITLIPFFDGGALGLATATLADRDSVRFGGPIVPNEIITGQDELTNRAIEWIRTGTLGDLR